ncbi:MAG TPA: hypothetical protein VK956_03155, partial [Verrucomicrobium sp.]|nr:hypothetical protein [Verrucomicrobium sp.]
LGRFPAPSEHSGVDSRLDRVVFRTLEKQREKRYQVAGEVSTDVRQIASTPTLSRSPAPAMPQASVLPATSSSLNRWLAWGCSGLVCVLLMLLILGVAIPAGAHLWRRATKPPAKTLGEVLPMNDVSRLGTQVKVDTSETTDGDGSLKVTAAHGAVVTVGELGWPGLNASEALWCEAQLKCADAPGGAYLEIWCDLADGSRVSTKAKDLAVRDTAGWLAVRVPVVVKRPVEIRGIKVNLVIEGPGTAWVDDIRFLALPR